MLFNFFLRIQILESVDSCHAFHERLGPVHYDQTTFNWYCSIAHKRPKEISAPLDYLRSNPSPPCLSLSSPSLVFLLHREIQRASMNANAKPPSLPFSSLLCHLGTFTSSITRKVYYWKEQNKRRGEEGVMKALLSPSLSQVSFYYGKGHKYYRRQREDRKETREIVTG